MAFFPNEANKIHRWACFLSQQLQEITLVCKRKKKKKKESRIQNLTSIQSTYFFSKILESSMGTWIKDLII